MSSLNPFVGSGRWVDKRQTESVDEKSLLFELEEKSHNYAAINFIE